MNDRHKEAIQTLKDAAIKAGWEVADIACLIFMYHPETAGKVCILLKSQVHPPKSNIAKLTNVVVHAGFELRMVIDRHKSPIALDDIRTIQRAVQVHTPSCDAPVKPMSKRPVSQATANSSISSDSSRKGVDPALVPCVQDNAHLPSKHRPRTE